jgi:hypothetical protein
MFCNFLDVWLRNVCGSLNQFFFNDMSVTMLQNAGCSAWCMLLWISSPCSWYFIYDKDKLEWQYFFFVTGMPIPIHWLVHQSNEQQRRKVTINQSRCEKLFCGVKITGLLWKDGMECMYSYLWLFLNVCSCLSVWGVAGFIYRSACLTI